jgi:hypothetical protein
VRPFAAPRIDDRLKRFIAGAGLDESAAQVTRLVGDLAEDLQLPRPSYQQVRVLLHAARAERPATRHLADFDREHAKRIALRIIDGLYEYPAPFLGEWYRREFYGL